MRFRRTEGEWKAPVVLYDLGGAGGDGCAFDAQGNLWVADFHQKETGRGRLTVVSPAGGLVGQVEIPAKVVSNLAFGGEKFDEAYCTTAEPPGLYRVRAGVATSEDIGGCASHVREGGGREDFVEFEADQTSKIVAIGAEAVAKRERGAETGPAAIACGTLERDCWEPDCGRVLVDPELLRGCFFKNDCLRDASRRQG